MDPIKIVVTNSDSTSVTSSTSYEQSQSATELNKTDHTRNAAAAGITAASLPASLTSTPTPHHHQHQHHNNGTKSIKSISKRRNELPPLKLSTYEPKTNKTFHLQVDDHVDVDDECRKLLLNPLVNKPFPSSQSTTSLNKRVTISSKSAFSRFEPSQSTGNQLDVEEPTLTTSYTSPQPLHTLLSLPRTSSFVFGDCNGSGKMFSNATSIRSLASIGMGSTDGRKMIVRRVPQSPAELLSIISPPVLPEFDARDDNIADDESDVGNLKPKRQQWSSKMQFVLACVGYSIGLGNVWRFPYLCYQSGGGVFLVPYFIILFVCGIPMLFMELAIGQYTGRGPIGAIGQLCPLFKGVGVASVVVSFLMSTYYSVIIAYAIYYFFAAFRPEVPWLDCSHRWTTTDCWIPARFEKNMSRPNSSTTPSKEFFENKVLQISGGLEYPGALRWDLVACLMCAWILVYFAIWKSIKSSAKVRYLTATLPFILIIIFLGRAVTLDGAQLGLRHFFRPKWYLLGSANVWINAAAQNFNSLGIAFGSMISFASYNKYNNNFLHDTLAVSFVNAITSLLVGIFAFATIGNIAYEQHTEVEKVVSDGPGLIFVVYPQAISKMPLGQMWSVLFFFMLLCLGLNSQFAIIEVVVTSIQDGFPKWIRSKLVYHELLVLIVVIVSFFFGLPNLIQAGIYYFQLIDHYVASITVVFLAFFQIIAIAWLYKVSRLSRNIKQMTGKMPSLYFRSCWLLIGPCLLFALFIFSTINYKQLTYDKGRIQYPSWAHIIGWLFTAASLIWIPIFAVISICRSDGHTFFQKLRNAIKPNIHECKFCGEHYCEHDSLDMHSVQEMLTVQTPTQPNIALQTPQEKRKEIQQQQHQQQQQQYQQYEQQQHNFDDTIKFELQS